MTEVHGSGSDPRVESRGGAILTKYKPLFSEDGKNVFCCCGHDVKVYNTKTGKCIGLLSGHTDFVTGVQLNPRNPLQVFTSSLDRTVISWDYADCARLKTIRAGFPITSMIAAAKGDRLRFYAICQESKNQFSVKKVSPSKDQPSEVASSTEIISNIADTPNALAVGKENRFVAAISGHYLIVYRSKEKTTQTHHTMDRRRLTCVAAHPRDDRLATGCANGSIVLWWNFMSEDDSPVHTSIHHWHALSVLALTFTEQGSYLLSGGHECVLVVWQDDMQHRDFLPRLGAPISHVSVSRDNTHYVTAHSDNMIQIIGNNLEVRQVIQGLTRAFRQKQKIAPKSNQKLSKQEKKKEALKEEAEALSVPYPRTGLHLDPRSNALVLNGRPGHLQFYQVQKDDLLFNLDIVGQNYVSPDNMNAPITVTEIDACALSPDGDWLATAQSRDDQVYSLDLCLKFWKFDDVIQSYSLNTSVDLAHQKPITCLRFRPAVSGHDHMCATTSRDGKFKLWTIRDDTDIYRESRCWDCESIGFYRERPAGAADFSQDGSVLAVAFGDVITLWNPDTNALQTTLECRDEVTHVVTGRQDCRHLLVACTKSVLMVWNVLSLNVQWVADSSVVTLARDPTSSNMAAFTHHRELFVFSPDNAKPVFTLANVSQHDVTAAIFIPQSSPSVRHRWMSGARLYLMDRDQKLLTVGYEEEKFESSRADKVDQTLTQSVLSLTLSQKLTAEQSAGDKLQAKPQPAYRVFDAPAHTLPPVASLATTFLHSLLVSRRDGVTEADGDSSDDMEVDSDAGESDSDSGAVESRRPASGGKDANEQEANSSGAEAMTTSMAAVTVSDCSWLEEAVRDVTVLE